MVHGNGWKAALASVVSSSRRGYVPPMAFARECQQIAERSELLNIPCALAVARPIPGSSALEILSHARITRAGDLTSTDGDLCFLFFSGCPETSIKKAIQAVMGDNLDATFVEMQFLVRRDAIRQRLQQLTVFAEGRIFPDTLTRAPGRSTPARIPSSTRASVRPIAPSRSRDVCSGPLSPLESIVAGARRFFV